MIVIAIAFLVSDFPMGITSFINHSKMKWEVQLGIGKAWPERKEDLMKQLMSYYVMDDDTDEKIREMTDNLGLDGIESLVYRNKIKRSSRERIDYRMPP